MLISTIGFVKTYKCVCVSVLCPLIFPSRGVEPGLQGRNKKKNNKMAKV